MCRVVLLSLVMAGGAVWAQAPQAPGTCSPSYDVKYGSCVRPESPTTVQPVTTDWILVNEGARNVTEALCTEHIKVIASENTQASNIKVASMDSREAPWRGYGKVDVYCKFSMEKPVKQKIQSEACGISSLERTGCIEGLTSEFVKTCLNQPSQSDEELWRKAGCLIDIHNEAERIRGLSRDDFDTVEFQLDLMRDRFHRASATENEKRLSRYIGSQLKTP